MNILRDQSGHGDYSGLMWGIILCFLVAGIVILGVSIGASVIVAKAFRWFGGSTWVAVGIGAVIGIVITAFVIWRQWV